MYSRYASLAESHLQALRVTCNRRRAESKGGIELHGKAILIADGQMVLGHRPRCRDQWMTIYCALGIGYWPSGCRILAARVIAAFMALVGYLSGRVRSLS